MNFTETPWRIHETQDMIAIFDKEGNQVATLSFSRLYEQRYFNAKRIVECVNAFEGIANPTEYMEFLKENDLQDVGSIYELIRQYNKLQNDSENFYHIMKHYVKMQDALKHIVSDSAEHPYIQKLAQEALKRDLCHE
jgi:hypothetical protein